MRATIFEAKTSLSSLVRQVNKGGQVIITSGRSRVPVAQLVGINPLAKKRLGVLADESFKLPAKFFEPLADDELDLWEGKAE